MVVVFDYCVFVVGVKVNEEEMIKEEYLKYVDEQFKEYEDSPYDEIPLAIMRLRDKFLELYK